MQPLYGFTGSDPVRFLRTAGFPDVFYAEDPEQGIDQVRPSAHVFHRMQRCVLCSMGNMCSTAEDPEHNIAQLHPECALRCAPAVRQQHLNSRCRPVVQPQRCSWRALGAHWQGCWESKQLPVLINTVKLPFGTNSPNHYRPAAAQQEGKPAMREGARGWVGRVKRWGGAGKQGCCQERLLPRKAAAAPVPRAGAGLTAAQVPGGGWGGAPLAGDRWRAGEAPRGIFRLGRGVCRVCGGCSALLCGPPRRAAPRCVGQPLPAAGCWHMLHTRWSLLVPAWASAPSLQAPAAATPPPSSRARRAPSLALRPPPPTTPNP